MTPSTPCLRMRGATLFYMSADLYELLADIHPVPAVADQLRERAAEDREAERDRGEAALAAIEEIAYLIRQRAGERKSDYVDLVAAIEEVVIEVVG